MAVARGWSRANFVIVAPYLLFPGDAPESLTAKVAQGIREWCSDTSLGQFRMDACRADIKLADMTLAKDSAAGARTLMIGVANCGGVIPPA